MRPAGGCAADWRRLIAAVAAFYRSEAARGAPGAALLGAAALDLERLGPGDAGRARAAAKPVRRFVRACLARAEAGPLEHIASAFATIEPVAEWLQNPNYTAATIGPDFLDAYGYVEPIGPGRLFDCANLRVGFLLLGPGLLYPDHAHPAEEVYHVVAGRAEWWREGEGWSERDAGVAIHHPPYVCHATRTGDQPVIALYCWGGEVGPAAVLSK